MGAGNQRVGKVGELAVMGELHRRGYNVYIPLTDVEGVDCIVLMQGRHGNIQVKTRGRGMRYLYEVKPPIHPQNLFVALYHLDSPVDFWVIPWEAFRRIAKRQVSGSYRIDMGAEGKPDQQRFQEYHNAWWKLEQPAEEMRPTPQRSRRRAGREGYSKLLETAEELIAAGRLSRARCPVVIGPRSKRYLIHSKPKHPNGKKFFRPKELSNGLWLETNASKERNRWFAKKLAEKLAPR